MLPYYAEQRPDARGYAANPAGSEYVDPGVGGFLSERNAQRVGAQRLTARIVADIVKAGASRLALDPATFGAHSLRSGLVTTAVKRGVNLLKICDQTGHKSLEMLRVYCRDAELFVGNAAAGLL
jgi:hypothetical protein